MLIFSAEHIYNGWLRKMLKNMTQTSLIISPIISIPFKPKGKFTTDIFQHVIFPPLQKPSPVQDLSAGEIQEQPYQSASGEAQQTNVYQLQLHTHTQLFPTHMHRHQRTLIHFQNPCPGRTIVLASQVGFSQAQCLGQRAIFCIGVRTDWEGE